MPELSSKKSRGDASNTVKFWPLNFLATFYFTWHNTLLRYSFSCDSKKNDESNGTLFIRDSNCPEGRSISSLRALHRQQLIHKKCKYILYCAGVRLDYACTVIPSDRALIGWFKSTGSSENKSSSSNLARSSNILIGGAELPVALVRDA
jgi:hypothetical protein